MISRRLFVDYSLLTQEEQRKELGQEEILYKGLGTVGTGTWVAGAKGSAKVKLLS